MRLRTSEDVENKLLELNKKINLSSKAAIMRIAIACSLKDKSDPRQGGDSFISYDVKMLGGADYQRMTIFGREEDLYRLLMINHMNRSITDEEFFPELTYAHIKRGINYMYSEYRYIDNKDKFFEKLIRLSN